MQWLTYDYEGNVVFIFRVDDLLPEREARGQ